MSLGNGAVEQGDIGLADLTVGKLRLHQGEGLARLRDDEQTAGAHVEPVGQCPVLGFVIMLTDNGPHAEARLPAWHAEQAGGLVDDHEPLVLIDHLQFMRGLSQGVQQRVVLLRIIFDIESFEHPCQDGQALASTGRIEASVVPHLCLGRHTHPELCHADGLQPLLIGILKELGGATVTCSSWRIGELVAYLCTVVIMPDLYQVTLLAVGVEHAVLAEKPHLQVFRHLLAAFPQFDGQPLIGKQALQYHVHGRDLPFGLLEMSVGLLSIEHGRHEPRPVVASGQQTAIGCQEEEPVVSRFLLGIFYHQDAEHLSVLGILP